jgi:hypothetical protein
VRPANRAQFRVSGFGLARRPRCPAAVLGPLGCHRSCGPLTRRHTHTRPGVVVHAAGRAGSATMKIKTKLTDLRSGKCRISFSWPGRHVGGGGRAGCRQSGPAPDRTRTFIWAIGDVEWAWDAAGRRYLTTARRRRFWPAPLGGRASVQTGANQPIDSGAAAVPAHRTAPERATISGQATRTAPRPKSIPLGSARPSRGRPARARLTGARTGRAAKSAQRPGRAKTICPNKKPIPLRVMNCFSRENWPTCTPDAPTKLKSVV